MSTQEIGALIESVTGMMNTVAGKVGEIDAKVKEATGAVPSTVKTLFDQTLYVHPINGNDGNDGKSSSRPLKSIIKAINLMPRGGAGRIEMLSDFESLGGGPLPSDTYQKVDINNRQVVLDLNGHTWHVKTVARNGWEGQTDTTVSLTTTVGVGANGFFTAYNGKILIRSLPEHVGKPMFHHVVHNSLIMGDACRVSYSTLTIDSDVPDVGLLGLDNWGNTGFDCHMGEVTLVGSGRLRRCINGADPEDIIIKMRSVARPETWLTGLPETPPETSPETSPETPSE